VEIDHLPDLEKGRQDLVLRDETDPAFDLHGLAVRVEAEDLYRSPLLVEHPHSDVEEGGLAGAVATEKTDHLSSFDIEVDTIENRCSRFERSVDIVEREDTHLSPPSCFRASGGRP
jgi:hypothetical protein